MSLKNNIEIPYYSTDAYSAEKVLDKTREKYTVILHGTTFWECSVFLPTGEEVSSGFDESLSPAICRAAQLTVIEKEKQEKIKDMESKQKLGNVFKWRFKYAKER